MRLSKVEYALKAEAVPILNFYMGKLVVPVEE